MTDLAALSASQKSPVRVWHVKGHQSAKASIGSLPHSSLACNSGCDLNMLLMCCLSFMLALRPLPAVLLLLLLLPGRRLLEGRDF
jgi:hypothetical protein